MGAKWFESQLVKLMFFGVPTDPSAIQSDDIRSTYVNRINSDTTQGGQVWKDFIPDNGVYDFNIFVPTYFSALGLVKLFRIDYTVLESNFVIQDADIFDNGYAIFNLKNTGTKDLLIKNVEVNGVGYNFIMGQSTETNILKNGDSDLVWVDLQGTPFQVDDVVDISVTVESEAFQGKLYEFSNKTSNFFVKKAEQGEIKINKGKSKVIQINPSNTEIFLEVENVGTTIEILDRIYLNDDIVGNRINPNNIELLTGSVILNPGDKVNIHISNVSTSFYPIRKYNIIGVATPNEARDEVLFTSTLENYSISVLSEKIILSPEFLAAIDSN